MRAVHVIAASVSTALLALTPTLAQAQFMGMLNGVSNAIGQVTSKATSHLLAGQGEDLQAAYDKFFGALDEQTEGMDAAAKRSHRQLVEQQWPSMELALLTKNAELQRKKSAPLLDLGEAANAAASGAVNQAGMQATIASASSGTGGGILAGAMGDIMQTAKGATASLIGKMTDKGPSLPTDLNFRPGKELHPLEFFGRHPASLSPDELYRENGFLGWKRIEHGEDASAYAPVLGDGAAQYAVFKHDVPTGEMVSAFRVLKVSPAAFSAAVSEFSAMIGAQPLYASQGSVLRAIWENGAFVTADGQKMSVGWSQNAAASYASKN